MKMFKQPLDLAVVAPEQKIELGIDAGKIAVTANPPPVE